MKRTKYIPDILYKKYGASFCRETGKEVMSSGESDTLLRVVDSYFNLLYERTTRLREE